MKDDVRIRRINIKPYKLGQLAKIYEVSGYVMRKSLLSIHHRLGNRTGYYYTTQQVEKIFKLLKLPSNVEVVRV